jgi:hypothetical protein
VVVSFIGGGNQTAEGNHRPVASHWQTSHFMLYRAHLAISGVQTHNFSSKKEVGNGYGGGGGHVFLVNYTINLSYIFIQINPI